MSATKELYLEKEQDFEALNDTSMKWDNDWDKQYKDTKRFSLGSPLTPDCKYIYWFENYANYMLCREILREFGEDFTLMYDENLFQYGLTTSYESLSWR